MHDNQGVSRKNLYQLDVILMPEDLRLYFLLIEIRIDVSASAAAEFSNGPTCQEPKPNSLTSSVTRLSAASSFPEIKTSASILSSEFNKCDPISCSAAMTET